ncbi:NUDIX hydrolase [Streptomyces griseorubiginosus]|uniref:NUDIX hydrolase n=1 Tax=Streptomyces griseorubiginosus TaxID=67304 RepID=UPI0034070504
MTATPETTTRVDYSPLKPLAAAIENAIQNAPIRLGTDDWGTVLGANILAAVSVFMGKELGPDAGILAEIVAERERQDARWGEQNHRDGTGSLTQVLEADKAREGCQAAFARGDGTWMHVLIEEVFEAFAEDDPSKVRAELVQVAAVAVAWIAAIDRRQGS